jgi:hypothetical protein
MPAIPVETPFRCVQCGAVSDGTSDADSHRIVDDSGALGRLCPGEFRPTPYLNVDVVFEHDRVIAVVNVATPEIARAYAEALWGTSFTEERRGVYVELIVPSEVALRLEAFLAEVR